MPTIAKSSHTPFVFDTTNVTDEKHQEGTQRCRGRRITPGSIVFGDASENPRLTKGVSPSERDAYCTVTSRVAK